MRNIAISKRSSLHFGAALAALLGFTLTPAPARAEICGDFDDIAGNLYTWWGDAFEGFFPIGEEKICGPLTGKFQSACEKSVKDAVKCWNKRVGEIPKAAKHPCSLQGNKAPSCKESFRDGAVDDYEAIEADAALAVEDCEDAADAFFDFCMFP